MKTAEIRQRYLDFFAARGHTVVPSASLVYQDPTLLFVNAGMVPFKPYFIGTEKAPFSRATSVQKCVRTLDIEEVGKTTRHGTFFQMNGNFSFGDYFKEGAISYAWELITSSIADGGYGLDPEKIWVTVLHDDDEAFALWQKVGVPVARIQRRGFKDNYWNMGIPGPGGPCSEIYVDRGPKYGPDGGPIVDEDRFLEIWNLVFMQEELSAVRAKDDFDVLAPLPKPNIDTGMGLERLAYLLQGKDNMYEIDEVFPVIAKASELSDKRYGANAEDDIRLRVVADHIRSALMLMTDGVTPGNEARGYVLRRLLRRAIRAMRLLGVADPVLPELLPVSKDQMSNSYPEVLQQWNRVSQNAYAEEESFRRTLAAGTQIFDLAVKETKAKAEDVLPGAQAFQLHDTYGFPIDLTLEMAAEAGLKVDRKEFQRLMQEQKDRAKADAKAKKGGAANLEAYRVLREKGETGFKGYTQLTLDTTVRGLIKDGNIVPAIANGDIAEIVLVDTPFYAEAGGQDADSGKIHGDGVTLEVLDVQKPVTGLIVHKVKVLDGELSQNANVFAEVDAAARLGSCQAHTATHVIHAVLREILGPTAVQAGSYNKPGYLRFDFSSTVSLTPEMQAEVEGRCNEAINNDYEIIEKQMSLTEAKELGAMAMFGEKYGDIVRVIEMGGPFSRELCGGTHVQHSAQIGLLNLLGESSVGSGVRRVEALVSRDAFANFAAERALVNTLSDTLKVQPSQLNDRVAALLQQLKAAEKEIGRLRAQQLASQADTYLANHQQVGSHKLITAEIYDVPVADLRNFAMGLRDRVQHEDAVLVLIGGDRKKPSVLVATTALARENGAKAGLLVREATAVMGGKGGGKDDFAQGGATFADQAEAAIQSLKVALR